MPTPHSIEAKSNQGGTSYTPRSPSQVTEATYWEKYYNYPDKVYEWHNGELEKKAVSEHITYLTHIWFAELLNHYLRIHPIAKPAGLEMGFRLILPNEVNVRRPDLGIVLNNNPIPLLLSNSSYAGIFDICIEAISESNKKELKRDTITKKAEYAKGGVKEYFILDGNRRYTCFYYLNAKGVYVQHKPLQSDVIESIVLPGFRFRIIDLYQQPSPEEMINDSVYQEFVLPGYTKEKQERHKAEQRADKAEQRADKAEQRTKQFAAKLRELGIDPNDIQ